MVVSRPRTRALDLDVDLADAVPMAERAAFSAAIWARTGRPPEPLKPTLPADAQAITSPRWSVIEMIVLLNEP